MNCKSCLNRCKLLVHRDGKSYPRNWVPTGPVCTIRQARASFSISGGGFTSRSFLMSLHVTRVGIQARSGGMRNLTPEWRQPHIAPPRASTTKLTRKLRKHITTTTVTICKSQWHLQQLFYSENSLTESMQMQTALITAFDKTIVIHLLLENTAVDTVFLCQTITWQNIISWMLKIIKLRVKMVTHKLQSTVGSSKHSTVNESLWCTFSSKSWRPFLDVVLNKQAKTPKLATPILQPPALKNSFLKNDFLLWLGIHLQLNPIN